MSEFYEWLCSNDINEITKATFTDYKEYLKDVCKSITTCNNKLAVINKYLTYLRNIFNINEFINHDYVISKNNISSSDNTIVLKADLDKEFCNKDNLMEPLISKSNKGIRISLNAIDFKINYFKVVEKQYLDENRCINKFDFEKLLKVADE